MKDNIQMIKNRINFKSFYSSELTSSLKESGNWWYRVNTLCPFHADTKPGSLHVNLKHGGYYCFACGAKGDVITFIKEKYHLSIKEVLNRLNQDVY